LTASSLHQFLRERFVRWGRSWRYISLNELERFFFGYKNYKYRATGVLAAFGKTEWQRNMFAYIDKLIFNHICPEHWKYIVYGIAEK
jgi:hypothetical protein